MIFLRLPPRSAGRVHGLQPQPLEQAHVDADDTILMELEGTLLKSASLFPYFMLVALEAGGPVRALILLLSAPLVWLLRFVLPLQVEIYVFTFITLLGLKVAAVETASRAVLAKFFLEDLSPQAFNLFKASGRRQLITSLPSIMVSPFASNYLESGVTGTKVESLGAGRYCTGRVKLSVCPGNRSRLVREQLKGSVFTVGIVKEHGDWSFLSLCQKRYILRRKQEGTVAKRDYIKPLVFHDGRMVLPPTPFRCLGILLWLPVAFPLAIIRLFIGLALPKPLAVPVEALLGVSLRVEGAPPLPTPERRGVLFVCTHRSLLDPIFISFARMRNVTTVTYSVSPVSEVISPIKTARLTRSREHDARTMSHLLSIGDLAVCPEGTTCREPFLLRFSALFAELTDRIVPVAVTNHTSMFHATTARGWKALDPLFFFMNPAPSYDVKFLEQLRPEETCLGGGPRPSHEVANHVQRLLADSLGYQCTNLTRKDKYRMLVNTDGLVADSSTSSSSSGSKSQYCSSSTEKCLCSRIIGRILRALFVRTSNE